MKAFLAIILTLCTIASTVNIYTKYQYNPDFLGNLNTTVNAYRAQNNVPELKETLELTRAAQAKCDDMVARKYHAHEDPDGKQVWEVMGTDLDKYYVSENLVIGAKTAKQAVELWSVSPSHNAAMLNTKYTEVGYGICYGEHFEVVQIFKGEIL